MDHLVSTDKAKTDVRADVQGKCCQALLAVAAQIRKYAQQEQRKREQELR
jgi:hypothetical protein